MPSRRRIIDDRLYAHFVTFSVYRRRLLDHDRPKRIVLGVLNEELRGPGWRNRGGAAWLTLGYGI